MRRLNRLCLAAGIAGALALPGGIAQAQDFANLKGNSARTGRNATPALSNPGRSFLGWWRPNLADAVGNTQVVDNLDFASIIITGVWGAPASVPDEANNPFVPNPNLDPTTNPSYRFAVTTPALNSSDPTVPQIPAQHATWTWTIDPPDNVARNYALYAWLPIGPTLIAGVPNYQTRYFVFEIFYGSGQRWVDVVDSYAAGTGWVRLGNGGYPTNLMFSYNGVNPIQIRLHNTVPRDDQGNLIDSVGNLVYADAVQAVPEVGTYTASPIVAQFSAFPTDIHVVAALNKYESAGPQASPALQGEVSSYDYDSSIGPLNTRWRFVPGNSAFAIPTTLDNVDPGVTVGAGWAPQAAPPIFQGADYLSQAITNVLAGATSVDYAPTLADGLYEIWAWLPQSGATFGSTVRYEINEGLTNSVLYVDQNRAFSGWVRIGARQFSHTAANPLVVRVFNYSPSPGDLGRQAFADAIRFVPAGGGVPIHSTPLHVTAAIRMAPAGVPVDTPVVIVAAEDGKIYCMDAAGNGDGTTNVYWTYPSTPDPNNPGWTDPNQVSGQDGVGPIAEMPTGFDLSTALVERIGGEDFLFIGSRNGRVYCIEMAGRGDMNLAQRVPGTTSRRWSYPNDYPAPKVTSFLGPISGSLAFANTASGPTVFVPTTQGRMYALSATGNPGNKTTNVTWTYPALTQPALGDIVGTPAVEFGSVFFGTMENPGNFNQGSVFSLDQDTGAVNWEFTVPATSPTWNFTRASHFASGLITIPTTELAGTPDLVVAANDNGWITALDAATGAIVWTTNELGSNVLGNLTFTPQTVFNNAGVYYATPQPCVIVPTTDGRLASLFANAGQTNVFGGKLAWGFDTSSGGFTASVAVGRNWMYAADQGGNLLAFSDNPVPISPGNPPGQEVIVPNDPRGIPFREAELVFITKDTYERLRLPTGAAGHLDYTAANSPARQIPDVPPPPYEWGETIYMMLYKFPYELDSNPIPPGQSPQAEFRIDIEGSSIRNMTVRSKQFSNPNTAPISGTTNERLDGYAVISFTLQGSGSTAVPPGPAQVTAAISAQFAPGSRMQDVILDPALTRRNYIVNNPLAVAVQFDNAGVPLPNYHIGYTINRNDPEAQVNGSPDVLATAKREDLLLASAGVTAHNQTGIKSWGIIDRSLMRLLRGPGRGLDQVRVDVRDLAWQGGAGAVIKPIDPLEFPNMEDLPVNFPNNSLSYPNIFRDRISIVKDRFGNTENPLITPSSLLPPTSPGFIFDPNTRTLHVTPTDAEIAVPRFQPANLQTRTNSALAQEPAGYTGRMLVWVDSTGNGTLERAGRREAFRSLWLATSVAVDERIVVSTPTVDLGSLAHGTGYRADAFTYPWLQPGSPFTPWGGPYASMFKEFTVLNEGNVNMLDMRLAKATREGANAPFSWGLFAPANHERSWLDTIYNLWSDIDATHAPINGAGNRHVILQKARVGDPAPSELSVNPKRRENVNLGVLEGFALNTATYPPGPPRVGVTVPIGFPVGAYVTTLRVIEDTVEDEALGYALLPGGVIRYTESYSDPGFVLRFNVRESRLTNSYSPLTTPFVHDLVAGGEQFLHQNAQPAAMRDPDGNLVLAYASTMSSFNQPQPATERLNDEWRIYLATMNGALPGTPLAVGQSLLPDLHAWSPSGAGPFFRQEVGPFPTGPYGPLFALAPGESLVANTEKFGGASMPLLGMFNPYSNAQHTLGYVTFIGEAQVQTPSGRRGASRPFIAAFNIAANGALNVHPVHGLPSAEGGVKGRPAVVVTANDQGTVMFAAGGSGQTQLYYVAWEYDGSANYQETPLRQLTLSSGFEAVGAPSLHARVYQGASAPQLSPGDRIFELTFSGKLRGRPHSEIFFARLAAGGQFGGPRLLGGSRSPLLQLPQRTDERLTPDGEAGVYRALGVNWNVNAAITLSQLLNGVVTPLEVSGSRVFDRQTNMITIDTVLGGKAYLDPNMGTVRFAGTTPSKSAVILLTYTPRILRVSTGTGAAYSTPSGLFDNRLIGEFSYWARDNNTSLVPPGGPIPGDLVGTARYDFFFGRAAAGAGQASRPYLKTYRLGVQLPTSIHTGPNGAVTAINVAGLPAGSYYQVDPANGRIYVTANAENYVLTVTYTGVDQTNGAPLPGLLVSNVPATMIVEREEAPVPIEQTVNEGQPWAFIDPFDSLLVSGRRPGLIWLFWMSTRGGTPDVYFQTIAPKFTPAPVGRP